MKNLLLMSVSVCLLAGALAAPVEAGGIFGSESYTISASASTLTVSPGQGGTIGITTQFSGCKSFVSFSASGIPWGVNYSFLPPVSETGTTLVLYVPSWATPGSYPVTVTGTSGKKSEAVSFTLVIPSIAPFTVSTTSGIDTLTLARGSGTSLEVSATGTSSYVKFGLTGAPSGVSVAFVPIDATDAYLVLYASPSATTGSFNVVLTGTANGVTASADGTLIVIK